MTGLVLAVCRIRLGWCAEDEFVVASAQKADLVAAAGELLAADGGHAADPAPSAASDDSYDSGHWSLLARG
ncbi:hypothetical protein [Actinokineospora globicatena]|uniref:hypothetical protein n=1 Tax=Actinokineospora globicatena TaxID=103729 RepID=UPI0020A47A84|nr:hypothetical protein [Actinokineospora globicatena]